MARKTIKTIKTASKKLSVAVPAKVEMDNENDFSQWADNQAKFLKNREFSKLDMDNLIEEINRSVLLQIQTFYTV